MIIASEINFRVARNFKIYYQSSSNATICRIALKNRPNALKMGKILTKHENKPFADLSMCWNREEMLEERIFRWKRMD